MLSKIIEHLEHFNKGFSVSKYLETYYNYDDFLVQTKEDFELLYNALERKFEIVFA